MSFVVFPLAAIGGFFLGLLMATLSIFLILLILVQRGKGGGLTGALGGPGGQSAFGSKAGDTFTAITIGVASVWGLVCAFAMWTYSPDVSVDFNEPLTNLSAGPGADVADDITEGLVIPDLSGESGDAADSGVSLEPAMTGAGDETAATTTEPETSTPPEMATEPETTAGPETTTQPEMATEPETTTQPEPTNEPVKTADPEAAADPKAAGTDE